MKKLRWLALGLAVMVAVGGSVSAAQVESGSAYCFSASDFSGEEEQVKGICILSLPDSSAGTVMLGSRVIQPGDILTAEQVEQMTFSPLLTEEDAVAVVSYLPVYDDRVEPETTMTISIRGKKDEAPVAEDFALETYKNLPNEGKLKVTDPEGQALTYTVTRQPRRGTLELSQDGTFVYTPKKNKVGVDSFTYTASDPAGNVSREATVTINILKPTDSARYTDTVGSSCRFEAEWLRNTGLFTGEKLGGSECFYPQKNVTRGEFLAMMLELLEIPAEETLSIGTPEDVPDWLKPYYMAAVRSGLTAGLPEEDFDTFRPEEPITGDAAAVLLQNALDLPMVTQTMTVGVKEDTPTFAQLALQTMQENGFELTDAPLTRAQVAELMYHLHQLAATAPGMAVYRGR